MTEAPRGRPLTEDELRELASRLADRPEVWAAVVRHDPGARIYERLAITEHVEVWLICWMRDHDTGFHDHDVSAGAVAVVAGAVREDRLVLDGAPSTRVVEEGGVFSFAAHDIHRVLHAGEAPAVTIHVYSPPLRRMGAYEIGSGGALARHSIEHDEELRPRAGAAAS
ncbi:MAG TPA: hypothetical protein VMT10_03500 [Solirubrobacteraceae bacterium]|nr:hypothetical protein [Solirubrobacteraceae bacterium]